MSHFENLTVVAFESRMALPMQKLIERFGGKAIVAPSMREIPTEKNSAAFSLFDDLKKGRVDLLILLTGVATRTFIATLEKQTPKEEILEVLCRTKICVRGPKPTAVCKMNNIPIAFTAPEPNTWREIINILTSEQMLSNKKVAVLEYGISNREFLEELTSLGALVTPVQVYHWALPEDLDPLNRAIDTIIAGNADLALFTTSVQVDHLLLMAEKKGVELAMRRALQRVEICSIGPVCSEKLAEHQLYADFEVCPNKMPELVAQAANNALKILKKKRERAERAWVRLERPEITLSPTLSPRGRGKGEGAKSPILRACRLEKNSTIPIWLMRQAGRYMAEYQVSRKRMGFMEMCKNPDLCAEITITAVERLGVDAAIIFSDILLLTEPMGMQLDYREGIGPSISNPVRNIESITALKPIAAEESLGFVIEAIRKTRAELHPRIPLIGFAGAPFTVASYMIEGRSSKNFIPTKTLMHNEPQSWHLLMEKISQASIKYLNAQVDSGADIVQIFDSWAGILHPQDYAEFVLPYSQKCIRGIKKGVPVIHFGSFTSGMLDLQKKAGGDVLSLDWRVDIGEAAKQLGPKVGLQGNLDPVLLFGNQKVLLAEAEKIMAAVGSRPGFIFNLGHGILPETPVDNVMALVDFVHDWKTR